MDTTKILIVEDESVLAMNMEMALIGMGYDVVGIADTGLRAVTLAENFMPDIIFMDIKLKGAMDGIEAAHKIYDSINRRVIFITAHTDKNTTERASKACPFAILQKPVEDYQIKKIINYAKK